MLGCKPADTPMDRVTKPEKVEERAPVDKERYQRLIGKLNISLAYETRH